MVAMSSKHIYSMHSLRVQGLRVFSLGFRGFGLKLSG